MKDVQFGSRHLQVRNHGLKSVHGFPYFHPFENLGGNLPCLFIMKDILVFMNEPSRLSRNQVLMKAKEMSISLLPPFLLHIFLVRTYIKGVRQRDLV